MNADSEKLCLEELDHLILDNDKKVWVVYIIFFKERNIWRWLKTQLHPTYEIGFCLLFTQVTVTYISNNFNVPNKDSETVLGKWIKNYSGDKKIAKEYLIRGTDLNGNSIITVSFWFICSSFECIVKKLRCVSIWFNTQVVNEKSLPKVNKVCPNHTKLLYSVEVSSINGKSLNVQEPTTSKLWVNKWINIFRDLFTNFLGIASDWR